MMPTPEEELLQIIKNLLVINNKLLIVKLRSETVNKVNLNNINILETFNDVLSKKEYRSY